MPWIVSSLRPVKVRNPHPRPPRLRVCSRFLIGNNTAGGRSGVYNRGSIWDRRRERIHRIGCYHPRIAMLVKGIINDRLEVWRLAPRHTPLTRDAKGNAMDLMSTLPGSLMEGFLPAGWDL